VCDAPPSVFAATQKAHSDRPRYWKLSIAQQRGHMRAPWPRGIRQRSHTGHCAMAGRLTVLNIESSRFSAHNNGRRGFVRSVPRVCVINNA
jgi:hypothetical protein